MPIGPLVVLVHALLGLTLVVGIVGRDVVLWRAAAAADLAAVQRHLGVATFFEKVVRPAGTLVVLAGFAAAFLRGQPVFGVFQGASQNWLLVSVLLVVATMVLIPTVFLPRGRVFEAHLADAEARGAVTPSLRAAFADRATWAARTFEWVALLAVLYLMLAKPF